MRNDGCDLTVIIVNWNAEELLGKCLESVFISGKQLSMEVVLVDNNSTDGSVRFVREHFPKVRIIENPDNRGFAAANNQAAERSTGKYLLLLNPDTEVLPGALPALVDYADANPGIGVLGPRLINADGTLQRSCWRRFPDLVTAFVDAFYLWKLPYSPMAKFSEYGPDELSSPRQVAHLLGACLLIRREAWDEVGPLDEDYFLFLEETDWCMRAHHAGWQIVYYPDAGVIHYGQHSAGQIPGEALPHFYRSYCRFYRKAHPMESGRIILLKSIIILAVIIRIGLWMFRVLLNVLNPKQRQHAMNMIEGYMRVLRELPSF